MTTKEVRRCTTDFLALGFTEQMAMDTPVPDPDELSSIRLLCRDIPYITIQPKIQTQAQRVHCTVRANLQGERKEKDWGESLFVSVHTKYLGGDLPNANACWGRVSAVSRLSALHHAGHLPKTATRSADLPGEHRAARPLYPRPLAHVVAAFRTV